MNNDQNVTNSQSMTTSSSPQGLGDFERNFLASLNTSPANIATPKSSSKGLIALVIILPLIIISVIIAIIAVGFSGSPGVVEEGYNPKEITDNDNVASKETLDEISDEEFYEYAYDETGDSESLNDAFASAAFQNEHAAYQTELIETTYARTTPADLCIALKTDCLSVSNIETNPRFEKVSAMNSNALDYYLDSDYIVVLFANYSSSADSVPLFIYARTDSFYLVFNEYDFSGNSYLTRSQIFNGIIGVPDFYIMKGTN